MKSIPEHLGAADWNLQLLEDLSFIKRKLRYPIRRLTLLPLFPLLVMLGAWFPYLNIQMFRHKVGMVGLLVFLVSSIPALLLLMRYINMVRFFTVATLHPLVINAQLLERFLKSKRLITFRHPEAPEVYQIISKNISHVGDEREVLIFIVDDYRILINSHFTSSRKRFRVFLAHTHHRPMIKELKKWLKEQSTTELTSLQRNF